jgi:hypothetical protein
MNYPLPKKLSPPIAPTPSNYNSQQLGPINYQNISSCSLFKYNHYFGWKTSQVAVTCAWVIYSLKNTLSLRDKITKLSLIEGWLLTWLLGWGWPRPPPLLWGCGHCQLHPRRARGGPLVN